MGSTKYMMREKEVKRLELGIQPTTPKTRYSLEDNDLATAGICLDEGEGGHVRLCSRV